MKKIFSSIVHSFTAIFIATLIATSLLYFTYLIPAQSVRPNIEKSAFKLLQEGEVFQLSKKLSGSKIDNFSTSIMLNNAAFLGRDNPFYDSLTNPRTEYSNPSNQISALFLSIKETSLDNATIKEYPRYWHGYLTILKPLLIFFDISAIRIINFILQFSLLILATFLIYKHLNLGYATAFLTSIFYINPISTAYCLQYSSTYYILLVSTIIILNSTKPLKPAKTFLAIGISTSFFDLLSAPLLTLGFPLIVYISLYKKSPLKDLILIIKSSIYWSLGYLGFWFSKWLIATIFTPHNIIKDGINTIITRTIGKTPNETRILVDFDFSFALNQNLNELNHFPSILIILFFLLSVCLSYFIKQYKFTPNYTALLTLLIGLYPFIWFAIVTNHSIIHPLQSFRILAIFIFALTSSIISLIPINNHQTPIK